MARHMHVGRDGQGHALISVSRPVPCPMSGPSDGRRKAWHRIQSEAPEVAELMRQVRARFGARAGVGAVVTIGGERVWPVEGEG